MILSAEWITKIHSAINSWILTSRPSTDLHLNYMKFFLFLFLQDVELCERRKSIEGVSEQGDGGRYLDLIKMV
jgi:hypothetical protein